MLTRIIEDEKVKCVQYWPQELQMPIKAADFEISLTDEVCVFYLIF